MRKPTIEAVRRREATVSDFIASRLDSLCAVPLDRSVGLSQRLGRFRRGIIGTCRQMASVIRPERQQLGRQRRPGHSFDDGSAPERLTVTYYYPWGYFHPVRSGAAVVASRHLDYFRQRGHRVRMMVRAAPYRGRSAFERYYHWVDDIAVVDVGRYPGVRRCFDTWNLSSYLAGHARLADQPEIREWLGQPADVAFINYVFSTPLLDALPADAYRVLETYDIMSHQFVEHHGSPELLERSLACELDLYGLYDSVLMINREEERFARSRCAAPMIYMPPVVDVTAENRASLGDEEYDLLFVGSDHAPNVEGVNWFYEHVYRPLLKAKGIRWAICGSVCRKLRFKDPNVIRLGLVERLGDVYRRSKVVVVPLFRGSGVSIKTLEALGHRKPVVTTPCGRRGLAASADDALVTLRFEDDPAAVADAISMLCSSGAVRNDYGRRAATCITSEFSGTAYGRRMDRILEPVIGRSRGKWPPIRSPFALRKGGEACAR